jgi:transcriptional regulator with XRE-family HTH domain
MTTFRNRRKQLGLTQVQLAKLSGVSQPRISMFERAELKLRHALNPDTVS